MNSIIKNFKQFSESNIFQYQPPSVIDDYKIANKSSDLDLNPTDFLKVKENVNKKLNSLTKNEKEDVFNEIEKMTQKLGCAIQDLTDPIFVKEHIDELSKRTHVVQEGFFSDIKDRVINFLLKVFEWGTAIGSILIIGVSALDKSFWGVMTGGIALTISIIASAYLSYHLGRKIQE